MNCKILKLRVERLFVLMHISHAQNYKRVIFIRLQDIKCLGCFVKWHELCIFAIGISISSQEILILARSDLNGLFINFVTFTLSHLHHLPLKEHIRREEGTCYQYSFSCTFNKHPNDFKSIL